MFRRLFTSLNLSLVCLTSSLLVGCPDPGPNDPCLQSPKAKNCVCEESSECKEELLCVDSICSDCVETEGCACGVNNTCADGLECNGAGICESVVNVITDDMEVRTDGTIPDADMDPPNECDASPRPLGCACEEGEMCAMPSQCRDGVCVECSGQEGCLCDADQSCEAGLYCNASGACDPCGSEDNACCR